MSLILKQEQCTLRTLQLQLLSQIMSKQHSGNEPASPRPARKELQECADLLKQVVSAKDVNMLSSRHRSLTKDFRLDNLSAYGVSWQELVLETNILPLLVKAMLHVFDLIAEGAGTSSLLEGSTACHVAIDLSSDLHHLLQHLSDSLLPEDKVHTSLMSQWKQAAVSGLFPVLTKYSQQVVIPALDKLAAATEKLSQQQPVLQKQQQQHRVESMRFALLTTHCQVAEHVCGVISLWLMLFRDFAVFSPTDWQQQPEHLFQWSAIPTVVHVIAVSVPLLSKGLGLVDKSSISSTNLAEAGNLQQIEPIIMLYLTGLRRVSNLALDLSEPMFSILADLQQSENPGVTVQRQQILLNDKVLQLLLLLLSDYTAGLKVICMKQSDPADKPEQQDTATAEQQQQQCRFKSYFQQAFFNSHKLLLTALGVPAVVHEADDGVFKKRECASALSLMASVVKQYLSSASLHESCSSSNHTEPQQGISYPAFPSHLILPAVKMFVQLAMMLPITDDFNIMDSCLELVILLMKLFAVTPPSAAAATSQGKLRAAAAAGDKAGPQACSTNASTPASTADDVSWRLLPPCTAAPLLHPILQLLSQAVIRSLRGPESARQKPIKPVDVDEAAAADNKRRSILHKHGHLLISVCQSVEPKHLAASLKSDWPVASIGALDAVIRTQSHHLHLMQREQQQPQHASTATPGHHTNNSPKPIVKQQAAAQYLQFVANVLQAVHLLVQGPGLERMCAQFSKQPGAQAFAHDEIFASLVMRLSMLAMTCHKVQRTVAEKLKDHTLVPVSGLKCGSVAPESTAGLCGILEQPLAYFMTTATQDLAGIAVALSKAITAQYSSSVDRNSHKGSQQQRTSDSNGKFAAFAAYTDNNYRSQYTGKVLRLPVMLLMRVLNAAVHQLVLDCESASTTSATATANAHLSVVGGCVEQLRTVSGLVFSNTDSLLSIVNMVDSAFSILKHLHGWQSDGPQVLMYLDVAVPATLRLYVRVSDLYESHYTDQKEYGQADWQQGQQQQQQQPWLLQRRQQQLDRLQSLGCLGRSILADCRGYRSLEQEAGSSSSKSYASVTAADVPSKGPADSSFSSPQSAAVIHDSVATSGATKSDIHVGNRIRAFRSQLADLSVFLASQFPVLFCCNEPKCLTLLRHSEYQLVSGKACVCGGCTEARYCSRECQKKHWKLHKQVCQKMPQRSE